MSIDNGHLKYKRHIKQSDGSYKLVSQWTSSDTVHMEDGTTLENTVVAINEELNARVPETRKVNGKDLSEDITLSASDVGADATGSANAALESAKSYADGIKNDLLNGAGAAYDTLSELGALIDDNRDAIDALETVASGKQATITGAASTVTSSNLTANRVLLSNESGKIIASSNVSDTEINYLDGVTSAIQTQLDGKMSYTGGTNLKSGDDLNDLKTPGIYISGSSSISKELVNTPSTATGFKVTVIDGYISGRVTQLVTTNSNAMYVRQFNGNAWAEWAELFTTSNVPTLSELGISAATTSADGLMTAAMVTKLNGIATGANAYTLPTASSSTLGGVKTTSTVTSTSGLTACPIISGVPYYKDTNTDTNTHYTTRIYAGASGTAANAAATSPYIKITDDNTYRNQIRLLGSGSVTVSSDANGNVTIKGTDTNTTYSAATTSANGLMTAAMVTKLNGIATGANAFSTGYIGTSHPNCYYKFSDGTLICVKNVSTYAAIQTAWDSGWYESAQISLGNWPYSFKSNPWVCAIVEDGGWAILESIQGVTTSSAGYTYLARPNKTAAKTYYIDIIAIGRWA